MKWKMVLTSVADLISSSVLLVNRASVSISFNSPSTDLTFASLNDIDVQCFVTDNLDSNEIRSLFGVLSTGNLRSFQQAGIQSFVNSGVQMAFPTDSVYLNQTLYGIRRDEAVNQELLKDGVEVDSEPDPSTFLPTAPLYVGALNLAGTDVGHINAKIAFISIEASIGFDNVLFNTVIRNSLTAYGTI